MCADGEDVSSDVEDVIADRITAPLRQFAGDGAEVSLQFDGHDVRAHLPCDVPRRTSEACVGVLLENRPHTLTYT